MSAHDTDIPADAPRRTATIANRRGLHARAAAKFVKLCATFDAQVAVSHRGTEVSGLSIMGLMMLAAAPGCSIEMKAGGAQADAVLDALVDLVDRKFDED
jgi:phosphocarrier protein HPr